jgi:hypothetical protein
MIAFHDLASQLERELGEMRRYLLLTLEQGNDLLPEDKMRAYELCEPPAAPLRPVLCKNRCIVPCGDCPYV